MSNKIQINLILEADLDPAIEDIFKEKGNDGLKKWAREEVLRLLEGEEELSADWGAKLLGIEIRKK